MIYILLDVVIVLLFNALYTYWNDFRFCNLVYIDEILTHFDYDIARNLAFTFYTRSNDFNYWNIIEIEKLEIPRITESYIINLRFVSNATASGNVKEIPF